MNLKSWWNLERVNRCEKGTSQDFCPTNGDAVMMFIIYGSVWVIFLIVSIAVR